MLSCSHIRLYQDSFSNFRVFFYSHATLLLILRRSVAAAYFHSQWSVQCVCWPHTRYPIPGLTPSPDFHDLSQNCSPASLSSQGGDFTLLRDALLWENYGTCGIFSITGGEGVNLILTSIFLLRVVSPPRCFHGFRWRREPESASILNLHLHLLSKKWIKFRLTAQTIAGGGEWVGQVGWDRIPTLNKNSFATNLKILMLRFWSAL